MEFSEAPWSCLEEPEAPQMKGFTNGLAPFSAEGLMVLRFSAEARLIGWANLSLVALTLDQWENVRLHL